MTTTTTWRPVPSLPGVLASSDGYVKFPEREASLPNGGVRKYKTKPRLGHITRSAKNSQHVYRGINHRFFGNVKVHQLVCEAFHGPKPTDNAVVIHLDEDGLNNNKDNLKWGSQKENLNMPAIKEYHRQVCRAKMTRTLGPPRLSP